MRLLLLLTFCWLAAGIARAEDIVAPQIDAPILSADQKHALEERSRALHDKADQMRQQAEEQFTQENNACWKKFLVSSCQKDAAKAKTERLIEARHVEEQAREIDHQLRLSNFAEKQAKAAADAPKKAADAAAQAEENRKERDAAMARVEKNKEEAAQRGKH